MTLVLVSGAACFVDMPEVEPTESESSTSSSSTDGGPPSESATSTTGQDSSTGGHEGGSTDGGSESTSEPATDESSTGVLDSSTTDEPAGPRLVFITEGEFFANLGGVLGADARCAAEAEAAGHPGEFFAWISDEMTSPLDRFEQDGGEWVRADGTVVADDWADLVDGVLDNPIFLDAEGNPVDDQLAVWTNTDWDGTALAADCQGWTSMAFDDSGIFGDFMASGEFGQWTAWGNPTPFPCENTFHLYCFEQ